MKYTYRTMDRFIVLITNSKWFLIFNTKQLKISKCQAKWHRLSPKGGQFYNVCMPGKRWQTHLNKEHGL